MDKKKNIRIRNVASQSQIWCLGAAETDYEVDMEILRGLENLGALWDSTREWVDSRSLTSRPELLDHWCKHDTLERAWKQRLLDITGYGMGALVDTSLPC